MSSALRDPIESILPWLQSLIAAPTAYPPGDTTQIAQQLHAALSEMGYETHTHTFAPLLANVVAGMGSGSPSLVFNAHLDTVGPGDLSLWKRSPFVATVENDSVYGLGAANCKGSAAIQLWLAQQIARRGGPARGQVIFTFVTDEESLDANGMSALRAAGLVKPDMLLLGAPTENALITVERGVLWVQLVTFGRAAHAGQPEDGDNAILRMLRILQHVDREMSVRLAGRGEADMRSTINIGMIRGGENTNVVPSRCVVQIDRRLLPSESVESAFAELRQVIEGAGEPADRVEVQRLRGTNGFRGGADGPLVSTLRAAIEDVTRAPAKFSSAIGVSDGRYFADDSIEIVNFGPGVGSAGHASNESVSIDALRQGARILEQVVERLLGYKHRL
jgi:acetylornithine deacetylase/succinyl-diaminopimelate desuccinylase family protein